MLRQPARTSLELFVARRCIRASLPYRYQAYTPTPCLIVRVLAQDVGGKVRGGLYPWGVYSVMTKGKTP